MNRKNISEKLKEKVRQAAKYRCGYCLFQIVYSHTTFEIDHIILLSKGGATVEENLWLACEICNSAKSDKTEGFDAVTNSTVPIFNPRTQNWNEHFEWRFTFIIIKEFCNSFALSGVTAPPLLPNKIGWVLLHKVWTFSLGKLPITVIESESNKTFSDWKLSGTIFVISNSIISSKLK